MGLTSAQSRAKSSRRSHLNQALHRTLQQLRAHAGGASSLDELLMEVYGTSGNGSADLIKDLRSSIRTGNLRVEVLDGAAMGGLQGAYTSAAPGGGERIYLNGDWLSSASAAEIEAVLLEELGHAIDTRLNGGVDTAGDEGERFSALARGQTPAVSSFSENDQAVIQAGGLAVMVEAAAPPTPAAGVVELRNASGDLVQSWSGATTDIERWGFLEAALVAALDGYSIHVGAGTYTMPGPTGVPATEDRNGLLITKRVSLYGAQAGVTATGEDRSGGETILQGWIGTNNPTAAITIQSDAVTVDGFKITNFFRDGITVQQSSTETTLGTGISLREDITLVNNWIAKGAVGAATSNGILIGENTTNNSNLTFDAILDDFILSGNYVNIGTTSARPIAFTSQFRGTGGSFLVSDMVMSDNIVLASPNGTSLNFAQYGAQTFTNANISDNIFFGFFSLSGVSGSSISDNTFYKRTYLGASSSTLANNIFTSNDGYFALSLVGNQDSNPTPSANLTLTANTFNYNTASISAAGYDTGLRINAGVDASTIGLASNIFDDKDFNSGALVAAIWQRSPNTTLSILNEANPNSFDGLFLNSSTSTTDLFAIADQVVDAIDVANSGLIELKAGQVYVTPNSFWNLASWTGYTSTANVQRAVSVAAAGNTVWVKAGAYAAGTATTTVDNLTLNAESGVTGFTGLVLGAGAFNATLAGAAALSLTGNSSDNQLTGNSAANVIESGEGNDSIFGGDGDDTITGGGGNDTINAGAGSNTITDAGNGNDTIVHDSASSTVAIDVTGTGAVTLNASQAGATANSAASTNTTVNASSSSAAVTLNGNSGADSLIGGDGDDTISGGAGNDSISGGNGDDSITAGAGDDTINAGAGANTITDAGNGSDTITHDSAASTVAIAVTGTDTVTLNASAAGATANSGAFNTTVNAAGSSFAVTLNGNSGNDTLTGGNGNDTISGGAGDDILSGGGGDDSIDGGAGIDRATYTTDISTDDIVAVTGGWQVTTGTAEGTDFLAGVEIIGNYLLVGGGGFATIQAAVVAASAGDTILVADGTYNETVVVNKDVTILGANDGIPGTVDSRGAESVLNGAFNITAAGVTIDGFRITSGASISGTTTGVYIGASTVPSPVEITNVIIDGTVNGITVDAAATGIRIDSNAILNNTIGINDAGLSSSDAYTSNSFSDQGTTHIRVVVTGPIDVGAVIPGSGGTANSFSGSIPEVTIQSAVTSSASITGTAFDDDFIGNTGAETFNGGDGDDTITGGSGTDTINAGAGTNTITDAGNGNDTIVHDSDSGTVTIAVTGTGIVTLNASEVGATANSSAGVNTTVNATGSAAAVTLNGSTGNDTLTGGSGNDSITGGSGNDTINAGAGINEITDAGEGADRINHSAGTSTIAVTNTGIVTLYATATGATATSAAGVNTTVNANVTGAISTAAVALYGDNGNDTFTGGSGADTIHGNAGDDSLFGSAGNDTLNGGDGNDTLDGGTGLDALDLSDGTAGITMTLVTSSTNTSLDLTALGLGIDAYRNMEDVIGTNFNDTIVGNSVANRLVGLDGDDSLRGEAGNDILDGGEGNDTLDGGTYNDTLIGGGGNDTLIGGAGLDILNGGEGDDKLQGGASIDTLTGGAGADNFYYEALNLGGTSEKITDFNRSEGYYNSSEGDKLVFDAVDLGLTAGALNNANFAGYATAPTAAKQFFLTRVGTTNDAYLYWDSNGTASGGRFTIARIEEGWVNQFITATDFTLI